MSAFTVMPSASLISINFSSASSYPSSYRRSLASSYPSSYSYFSGEPYTAINGLKIDVMVSEFFLVINTDADSRAR